MNVFDYFIEVCCLIRKGACTDHFDHSIVVNYHVFRVHVPNFLPNFLKLVPSAYKIVQKVPHFSFEEITTQSFSILDLNIENKWKILVSKLQNTCKSTLTMPLEPHIPDFSNSCF